MKESRRLEFKRTLTPTFLKTVCAFANYDGGEVIFGIDDEGNTVGIDNPKDKCLSIEHMINDNISPIPTYVLIVDDKKRIITLKVEPGLDKPFFYKSQSYKRNDTSTIPVDRTELTRLILEGKNLSYEEMPSKKKNLTFDTMSIEIKNQLGIELITKDILITLELCDRDGNYNIGAELLADENGFPGIDAVRFGANISMILDRKTIEHVSILKQYNKAVEMFCQYYQYEEIAGSHREKEELIPENAFREAIANALVHRMWDVNSNIEVSMYEDRIEVVSPGGLPSGISEEDYLSGGISMPRNPIICNVFMRLNMIERFGTGIRRIKEAYKDNTVQPQFIITNNTIRVILPKVDKYTELTEGERIILEVLKKNGNKKMSSSEIVSNASIGKTKVVSLLNKLSQEGYIKKEGKGRGTKYSQ